MREVLGKRREVLKGNKASNVFTRCIAVDLGALTRGTLRLGTVEALNMPWKAASERRCTSLVGIVVCEMQLCAVRVRRVSRSPRGIR